jgi:hypothetical protein
MDKSIKEKQIPICSFPKHLSLPTECIVIVVARWEVCCTAFGLTAKLNVPSQERLSYVQMFYW